MKERSKKYLKNIFLTLAISTAITLIIFVAIFLFVILIWSMGPMGNGHTEYIKTEYGDKFKVVVHDPWLEPLPLCNISHKNQFLVSIDANYEDIKIIGIWNTSELRCYRIGEDIIFRRKNSRTFELFDGNLYSKEYMAPVMRSFLLNEELSAFGTYLPYFMEKFPEETEAMLQSFVSGEYEALSEYGLTDDVINDTESLKNMLRIAKRHLEPPVYHPPASSQSEQ